MHKKLLRQLSFAFLISMLVYINVFAAIARPIDLYVTEAGATSTNLYAMACSKYSSATNVELLFDVAGIKDTVIVPIISRGTCIEVLSSKTIDQLDLPMGESQLIVNIDPNNKITETNETNNTVTMVVETPYPSVYLALNDDYYTETYPTSSTTHLRTQVSDFYSPTSIEEHKFTIFLDTALKTQADGKTLFTASTCNSENILNAVKAKFTNIGIYEYDANITTETSQYLIKNINPTYTSGTTNVYFQNNLCKAENITFISTWKFSYDQYLKTSVALDTTAYAVSGEQFRTKLTDLTNINYYEFEYHENGDAVDSEDIYGEAIGAWFQIQ